MPGVGEIAPYLHVSTYASWNDVGAWYWRLVEESARAPTTRSAGPRAALVKRGMTDAERVRAVYDFVVSDTRYVGLEFGIHGYKPYKVTQVLARRFGDCKDKAALMVALLREVGVAAELVLVRTRRGGHLDTEPASLAIFDHAIVYVPEAGSLPRRDGGVLRASRAAGAGPGHRGAAGRAARQRADRDAGAAVERQPRRRRWQVALEAVGRRARRRGADHPRPGGARLARALPDRGRAQGSLRARLERALPGRAARVGRRCRRSRIGTRP